MGSQFNIKSFGNVSGDANTVMQSVNHLLVRQPSIYSLTFDEFQNTRGGGPGKDFGSMNMDELLKSIWTAEEAQAMENSTGDDGSNQNGNLQRQGSLTLPRTLSQKTVDEVWRDLIKESNGSAKDGNAGAGAGAGAGDGATVPQRQPTLGEMTLEAFLARAGVVREDTRPVGRPNNIGIFGDLTQPNNYNAGLSLAFKKSPGSDCLVGTQAVDNTSKLTTNPTPTLAMNEGVVRSSQQVPLLQLQQPLFPKPAAMSFASPTHLGNGTQLPSQVVRSSVVGVADSSMNNGIAHSGGMSIVGIGTGGLTVSTGSPASQLSQDVLSKNSGDSSSLSPAPYAFSRGRKANTTLEKVIERRQRRMIKNRESAARSRARKQAYTLELEAEVAKLKEQNQELQRKQEEMMKMQQSQFLETANHRWGGKRRCLRRTLTALW